MADEETKTDDADVAPEADAPAEETKATKKTAKKKSTTKVVEDKKTLTTTQVEEPAPKPGELPKGWTAQDNARPWTRKSEE